MLDASLEQLGDRVVRYQITQHGSVLTYANVLEQWSDCPDFRTFFISLLQDSSFQAYRWETPPITEKTVDRDFEFVLIDTPSFATRATDTSTFASQLQTDPNRDVVQFPNLGGDAELVVPSQLAEPEAYGHLAAFMRYAPQEQHHSLWKAVSNAAGIKLGPEPVWISTAGGGVAYLHVRLDSQPKYYHHRPYCTVA